MTENAAPRRRAGAARAWSALQRSRGAAAALAALGVLCVLAALAPWISPQNPYDLAQLDVVNSRLAPGAHGASGNLFVLGTDEQGRDMLSAILFGLRVSLTVGLTSTLIALAAGTAAGILAAYEGGAGEAILMRIVDLQLSFPAILIALVLLAGLGQGSGKVIAALALTQWAYFARTVRSAAVVTSSQLTACNAVKAS